MRPIVNSYWEWLTIPIARRTGLESVSHGEMVKYTSGKDNVRMSNESRRSNSQQVANAISLSESSDVCLGIYT